MKTILIKTNTATQTIDQVSVVTQSGAPTIIQATNKVNYELQDTGTGRAPKHIVTKRVNKDLHLSFDEKGESSDVIIEDYFEHADSALVGVAENGEYYYYLPSDGEAYSYVTQLESGEVVGQTLTNQSNEMSIKPWWIPAAAGLGVVSILAASNSNSNSNNSDNNENKPDTPESVNNVPTSSDTIISLNEDTQATGTLSPATDADGDSLTYTIKDNPTHGSVTVNADGSYSYTPDPDYNGSDSFTYTIDDGNGGVVTQNANVTITAVNDAPVLIVTQSNDFIEDDPSNTVGSVVATYTTSDEEGNTVTVTLSDVIHYALDSSGNVTLTQAGLDLVNAGLDLPSFTLTPDDGSTDGSAVSVDSSVTAVNDAPVLTVTQSNTFTEDDPSNAVGSVVATYTTSDEEGNTVTVTLSDVIHYALDSSGNVTLTQAGLDLVNAGLDLPIFTLMPNDGTDNGVAVSVNSSVTPVNDAPTATDNTVTTDEDITLTLNTGDFGFRDDDGDSLSAIIIDSLPTNGTLSLNGTAVTASQSISAADIAANQLTFTPAPDVNGAGYASFDFKVQDDSGATNNQSASQTITMNVTPVNDAPIAQPDSFVTFANTPITGNVLVDNGNGADSDIDSSTLQVTAGTFATTNGGSVTIDTNGDFSYTPVTNSTSGDSFIYTLTDGNGGSTTGTVAITVNPLPLISIETTDELATEGSADNTIVFTLTQNIVSNLDSSVLVKAIGADATAADISSISYNDADGNLITINDQAAIENFFNSGITVTIPAGTTSIPITFTVVDDDIYDPSQLLVLDISNAVNAVIDDSSAFGIINDENDGDGNSNEGDKPTLTITPAQAVEGESLVHEVTVTGESESSINYSFSLIGDSATAGTDFNPIPTFTVTQSNGSRNTVTLLNSGKIKVGSNVQKFTVSYQTTDDSTDEPKETTTLIIGSVTAIGTIIDNDAPISINLADIATNSTQPSSNSGFVINGETADDRSGYSVSAAGDVNGDGLTDLIVGAYASNSYTGKSYVVFGTSNDDPIELSQVALGTGGFVINGEAAGDYSGYSVSAAGDVNGDGLADLLVGAYGATANGNSLAGKSYVVFGKTDSSAIDLTEVAAGTGGFVINGEAVGDQSGYSVSAAGDVNGDGLADIIVGAIKADAAAGKSYVVFGKTDSSAIDLTEVAAGTGGFVIKGQVERDNSGVSVSAAGDVNGDGLADIIVGAFRADANTTADAGRSYVLFGKAESSAINLNEVAAGRGGFMIVGQAFTDYSGRSVSAAGDVNGDGLADLLIGAYGAGANDNSDAGKSYVVFGKADNTAIDLSNIETGNSGFVINGEAADDYSGCSVSAAGDVNGDGLADLLVGAYRANANDNSDAGKSYVVFGKTDSRAINLTEVAAGRGGFVINGEAKVDQSGFSVSAAGDINGDGLADLLVGANGADPSDRSNAGKSYVIFGSTTGTIGLHTQVDQLGTAGDDNLISDSSSQTLVGGAGNDTITGGGGADVLYGGSGDDTFVLNADNIAALSAGVTDGKLASIDGGSGIDIISLVGSGINFDLTAISNTDAGNARTNSRLDNVEIIDITGSGDNTLTLELKDVLDMTSHNVFESTGVNAGHHQLMVRGNAGDTLDLADAAGTTGWSTSSTSTIDAVNYDVWQHDSSAALINVDQNMTVI